MSGKKGREDLLLVLGCLQHGQITVPWRGSISNMLSTKADRRIESTRRSSRSYISQFQQKKNRDVSRKALYVFATTRLTECRLVGNVINPGTASHSPTCVAAKGDC